MKMFLKGIFQILSFMFNISSVKVFGITLLVVRGYPGTGQNYIDIKYVIVRGYPGTGKSTWYYELVIVSGYSGTGKYTLISNLSL